MLPVLVASTLACGPAHSSRDSVPVIVLGVDGMDPAFVARHWDALPNLAELRDEGSFHALATTMPPQSPVAWSSFITGTEPGEHGIFDFVHRDAATLQPFSSMSRNEEPEFTLPLGSYSLPLSSARVISLRHGTPFWQKLADEGNPVNIVRMPTNYPPAPVGHAIAGMGVPDLGGTLGTFTFFTDDPLEYSRSVAGGHIRKTRLTEGHGVLAVEGPPNALRRDHAVTTANLEVDVDPRQPFARLALDGRIAILREGEWSEWMPVEFELAPHFSRTRGMVRIFAKQLHPRLALYVSPVNIDPVSPALPVSYPANQSERVARETGRFYTMGTPEDTAALRQNVFTLDEFRGQTRMVLEEERRLLRYSLVHFDAGLLFFYFSVVDQSSHMLWGKHETELLQVYRSVDAAIGETMRAKPHAELIVMSDHGFTTFDRAVHLNTWLNHRGFLTLTQAPGTDASLGAAEWTSTEAYAMGLNGLYLNMKGRERNGTVAAGAPRDALLASLREQLAAWKDTQTGRQVVEVVSETHPSPRNATVAPDLIVGYAAGYRGSWQTALGGVPEAEIENNDDAWIGDHCVNPARVPGVFFRRRKGASTPARLEDVTALIEHLYSVPRSAR